MGTIRNRMVIVHHYSAEIIEIMRKDAIEHFQKLVKEDDPNTKYIVSNSMVSPILTSPINGEYSFVIMGTVQNWAGQHLNCLKGDELNGRNVGEKVAIHI